MSANEKSEPRSLTARGAATRSRIVEAALRNPHMTEVWIVKAVTNQRAAAETIGAISRHKQWSLRRDVRIALLRNDYTPLARALLFAQSLPSDTLREVLRYSHLSPNVKEYLLRELEARAGG